MTFITEWEWPLPPVTALSHDMAQCITRLGGEVAHEAGLSRCCTGFKTGIPVTLGFCVAPTTRVAVINTPAYFFQHLCA